MEDTAKNLRYSKTPIGIFDSGVGGLSVLKELEKILPNEHYIYFGDTKNLPYGNKTQEEIINFGKKTINFFKNLGVKNVVMACNTSSALAYTALEKEFGNEIRIFPIIQTVAKDLAKYNRIGIMATVGTVKSLKYSEEILKINPNADVYEIGCEDFVKIVENRLYDDAKSVGYIEEKLNSLLELNVEKIVLGCTHYPYLMPIFTKNASENLFIDPATIFVQNIANEIKSASAPFIDNNVKKEFFVSAEPGKFKENAKVFFDIKDNVKEI